MDQTDQLSRGDFLRREFILKGSIIRVIPLICSPLVLYQGFTQLYRIIDNIMAAHISPTSVSAVAYLTQINQLLLAIGGGLAVGASILVSRFFGSGDLKKVKELSNTLFAFCGVLSLFVFLMIPFAKPILLFFKTPVELINEGIGYFIISLIDIVITFYNTVYISLERAMGNSKRILYLNVISIFIKIILTWIFVYILKTNLSMLAIAGVIANLCILIPGLYFLLQNKSIFSLKISKESFSIQRTKALLKISYPVITEKVSFAFGKIGVNSMSTIYGALTVGALGISNNLSGFVTSLQNGFQDGCSSVISQNLGASNISRALQAARVTLYWNLFIGVIGYIATIIYLPQMALFFSSGDPAFAHMIEKIYGYEASGLIALSINATALALLYGFGYTKLTFVINFSRVLIFRIPLLWILQHFTSIGIVSVGIVMMVSNVLVSILSGAIALGIYISQRKKLIINKSKIILKVGNRKKDSFDTIQAALDFILQEPACTEACIYLSKRFYNEQIYFDGNREHLGLPNISLTIKGRGKNKSIITSNYYAYEKLSKTEIRGTFRSYTAFLSGPSIVLKKLTIENTAGSANELGRDAGQAIALYADARFVHCTKVGIYGHQDSLFMAPLPLKERIDGGFNGPRKNSERYTSIQIYNKCSISGTIDFIFGGAGALFKKTNILVRELLPKENGNPEACYIAAPSSDFDYSNTFKQIPSTEHSGFVFYKCLINHENSDSKTLVYLARPWRAFARCVYIKNKFLSPISSAKWDNWDSIQNETSTYFAEYKNNYKNLFLPDTQNHDFGKKLNSKVSKKILAEFKPYL